MILCRVIGNSVATVMHPCFEKRSVMVMAMRFLLFLTRLLGGSSCFTRMFATRLVGGSSFFTRMLATGSVVMPMYLSFKHALVS